MGFVSGYLDPHMSGTLTYSYNLYEPQYIWHYICPYCGCALRYTTGPFCDTTMKWWCDHCAREINWGDFTLRTATNSHPNLHIAADSNEDKYEGKPKGLFHRIGTAVAVGVIVGAIGIAFAILAGGLLNRLMGG